MHSLEIDLDDWCIKHESEKYVQRPFRFSAHEGIKSFLLLNPFPIVGSVFGFLTLGINSIVVRFNISIFRHIGIHHIRKHKMKG